MTPQSQQIGQGILQGGRKMGLFEGGGLAPEPLAHLGGAHTAALAQAMVAAAANDPLSQILA